MTRGKPHASKSEKNKNGIKVLKLSKNTFKKKLKRFWFIWFINSNIREKKTFEAILNGR